VTEVRPRTNQVVVGHRKDLEVQEVRVGDLNWFLDPGETEAVQVRYNSQPVPCEIEDTSGGEVCARLAEPVVGVAPGQSAVFYKGDRVVGGGVVRRGS
jgi:tRNA-specific 2-thiouridylase